MFHCIHTPHLLYPLICQRTLRLFPCLGYCEWTRGCRYLFNIVISFLSDIYPEVKLLDHMVALLLIFWGNSILFSIVAAPIYMPTNTAWGFHFLHTLTICYLLSLMIAILRGEVTCKKLLLSTFYMPGTDLDTSNIWRQPLTYILRGSYKYFTSLLTTTFFQPQLAEVFYFA